MVMPRKVANKLANKLAGKKKNKQGRKNKVVKADKIHGKKAGEAGQAANYMTRASALSKLQVPLADFRKLCILKGIYPRDPKKKPAGNDKTYYHKKDILYLTHEPLLNKFFELKTFVKKFKRYLGRNERDLAKGIEKRKPKYTLHHLVRERYNTFSHAIGDLDDALSMLALFQALSADQKRDIPNEAIVDATRLYQEFQLYVVRAQALRKVFASIKGYYFQAEICGQTVTWLAPHQFAQELPGEVDFRVMLTFLEFYRAVLKFINFKLYADLGMSYPPKRDEKKEGQAAEVAALESEMREAGLAREAQEQKEKQEDADVSKTMADDFGADTTEAVELRKRAAEQTRMKTTFRGMKAFINREVPLRPVYFVLLCGGVDECGWERGERVKGTASGSAFPARGKQITHQIVDKPQEHLEMREGREFVQPQWVFDSFNTGCQLPVALYAPGRAPPPHLSPFVDDKAEGYVPRQRELLDKLAQEASGQPDAEPADDGTGGEVAKPADATTAFDKFHQELKAESEGTWHSNFAEQEKERAAQRVKEIQEGIEADAAAEVASGGVKAAAPLINPNIQRMAEAGLPPKEPGPKPTEAEEERMRAKALMTNKHKRLLQKIEQTKGRKEEANERLKKRRIHSGAQEQKAKTAAEGA